MIPPPIPIRPERKPITAPINSDKTKFDFFTSSTLMFAKNKNLIIGIINNMPNTFLYMSTFGVFRPPKKAIGTEPMANGKKTFQLKCLPR